MSPTNDPQATGNYPASETGAHAPGAADSLGPDVTDEAPVPPYVGAPAAGPDAPPGYEVAGELGRGGMGVVYRARQVTLNRPVALKMILRADASRVAVARFWAEAEVMAAVDHPHVVRVFELGDHAGRPFMAMEYAPGGTLADRLAAGGPGGAMAPREAAALVAKVARGVAAAHELEIVHRDLKPGNVLLDEKGEPKVADFGLAKRAAADLTQTQVVMGTPAYMAPEQAAGRAKFVGPAADVWALGVILYECVAGRRPFEADSAVALLSRVQSDEPPALRSLDRWVPRDLETICLKCLAKNPAERYPTAAELADDLDRFSRGLPIAARPAGPWERAWKWVRLHPTAAGFGVASVVALLSLVAFFASRSYQFRLAESNARLEDALGEADRLRGRVEEQERRTREALNRVERVRYAPLIALARRDLEAGDLGRAEEGLEGCPAGTRGWEWSYLAARAIVPRTANRGDTGQVLALAYSPDGERLAAGSRDGTVRVRDENLLREKVVVVRGHHGPVRCVALSGSFLAAAGDDGAVRIWELTNQKDVFRPTASDPPYRPGPVHAGKTPVRALAYSADGRLAWVGEDGGVKAWDVGRGAPRELGRHDGPGRALAFHPDGRRLATAGDDRTVRVWKPDGGHSALGPHAGPVVGVAWNADGSRVAAGAAGTPGEIVVWDAGTGRRVRTLDAPPAGVFGVAYTPDGRLVATGLDGTIRIWADDDSRPSVLRPRPAPTTPPVVRPDGKFLAVGGGEPDGGGEVTIWDLSARPGDRVLAGHAGGATGLAFGPGGERLASGGADGLVRLWDATTGREFHAFRGHDGPVTAVAVAADGLLLASAGRDGTVRLWDVPTGVCLHILKGEPGTASAVTFAPDGGWIAAGTSDRVTVWDANTGRPRLTLRGHEGAVSGVAVSPDGRRIATSGADRTVRVWDAADGQELLVCRGHAAGVAGVAFNHDGTRLASAGADRTVRVWDAADGKPVHVLKGHPTEVRGVAYGADGTRLASAGSDGTVRLWDPGDGSEVFVLSPRGGAVAVAFADRRLAAVTPSGPVLVWDAPALSLPPPDRGQDD